MLAMRVIKRTSLLFHTLRHLRARQISGQARNRLRSLWECRKGFSSRKSPPFPGCQWTPKRDFLPPGCQENTPAELLSGRFAFLNREETLGWPPDWAAAQTPKLWQYNLHYFEWLWALNYPEAREAVQDWIARHPLDAESVGWEPYPISLRLINWCGVFFGKFRENAQSDGAFLSNLWRSLFLQTEWLAAHVETHLLGNHYFENAAALAFVGSCFQGADAQRWLARGKQILESEIREQILPDGMHFELSPMYHLRMTYLLLLLLNTGREEFRELLLEPAGRMVAAMREMCHPDGEIALFNDSAFGIYNTPRQILDFWSGLHPEGTVQNRAVDGPWRLPHAGYYGCWSPDGSGLICDAGEAGPDYIPGHAHGDIFSFELSLKGQRVIVDSGVYDYVPGEMRRFCRSTRAHNTVEINGMDQCEFWGAFRVARRGRPRDVSGAFQEDGFTLAGWHDGYKRLPGSPRHRREFQWQSKKLLLLVKDQITASRPVQAISRIHLHPDCAIASMGNDSAEVTHPAGRVRIHFDGPGKLESENSFYCPEFGRKIPNIVLAFHCSGARIESGFRIEAL